MFIKQNLTHLFLKRCLTLFIDSIVILNFRPKRNGNDKGKGGGGGKKGRRQSGLMCQVMPYGRPWLDCRSSPQHKDRLISWWGKTETRLIPHDHWVVNLDANDRPQERLPHH